jgi:hypothetical protein
MPQLDLVTFFSQYLWLVVIYLGFYLVLVHSFLPKLARILKVRAAMISTGTDSALSDDTSLQAARDNTSVTTLQGAKSALAQGFGSLGTWVTATKDGLKNPKTTAKYTALLQDNARLQALVTKDVKALMPLSAMASVDDVVLKDLRLHTFHMKTVLAVTSKQRRK